MLFNTLKGNEVEIKGEPWYLGNDFCYFPRTKILINSREFSKYYDHIYDDFDPDLPEYILKNIKVRVFDFNDEIEIQSGLNELYFNAVANGRTQIQNELGKALGIR